MEIFGLAAWYKINMTLIPMPAKIPISNGNTRHAMNAAIPGIKSVSIEQKKNSIKLSTTNWLQWMQTYFFFATLA